MSMEKNVSSKYIPDDIAFSILSKLPVKSLKRFECVRKSWSLLFENSHFMNMFRNDFLTNSHRSFSYYDQTSLLLQVNESDQPVFYSLYGDKFENKLKLDCSYPIRNNKRYFPLLGYSFGSIHGPLCVYERSWYHKLALWNPATDEFKVIPPSPVELSFPNDIKLLCTVEFNVQGFGYGARYDYKVIRYVGPHRYKIFASGQHGPLNDTSFTPLWEIYSLRSNSWRKLDVDMPASLDYFGGVRVYMDGVCHWLCEGNSQCAPCLVSFDLSNEIFSTTPVPFDVNDSSHAQALLYTWLAVLNGSIALILCNRETCTHHILILGQVGLKESWTELFIVGPLPCFEHFIGMGRKGEIFFTREDNGELTWFDLSTQMIHELGYKVDFSKIVIYKENILPIEGVRS